MLTTLMWSISLFQNDIDFCGAANSTKTQAKLSAVLFYRSTVDLLSQKDDEVESAKAILRKNSSNLRTLKPGVDSPSFLP